MLNVNSKFRESVYSFIYFCGNRITTIAKFLKVKCNEIGPSLIIS